MAITLNGSVTHSYTETETSPIITLSHTVAAGSDRLLTVAYIGRSVSKAPTGITFGGVALTQGVAISGNTFDAEVWYLIAPAVSTANVVVTLAGGGTFAKSGIAVAGWDGVAQSSVVSDVDSSTSAASSSTGFSALTTTVDECLVIDAIISNSAALTMTAETNRSMLYDFALDVSAAVSYILPKSPAGAVTMNWTHGIQSDSQAGIAFKPVGAGGGPTTFNTRSHPLGIHRGIMRRLPLTK